MLLLIALIAGFIYLNKKNYYQIKPRDLDGGDSPDYFSPDADYYTLKDSWVDLEKNTIADGKPCYSDNTCVSKKCLKNPATGETKCMSATATVTKASNASTTGTIVYSTTGKITILPSLDFESGDSVTITMGENQQNPVASTMDTSMDTSTTIILSEAQTSFLTSGFYNTINVTKASNASTTGTIVYSTTGKITILPSLDFESGDSVTITMGENQQNPVPTTMDTSTTIILTEAQTISLTSGFYNPSATDINDYGTPILYTAICSQKKISDSNTESYYPDYKSPILINEGNESWDDNCTNYTFQQTILEDTCYDSDQLAGTKIVELCQAAPNSNQICLNNNGDRVYAPELNSLYIKPSPTVNLCNDNTSINYISFSFNNVPQTINTLTSSENFNNNQIACLSIDTVDYWPDFSVNTTDDKDYPYYITFSGTWGYKYYYLIKNTTPGKQIFSPPQIPDVKWCDSEGSGPLTPSEKNEIIRRLKIDNDYGITYNIPSISIDDATSSFKLFNFPYYPPISFGATVDMIGDYDKIITTTTSLKPCAIFDSSYDNSSTSIKSLDSLDSYVDKQKFKVSRFSMEKGALNADPSGMVSSIIYRNLNHENGGLYLDYYNSPSTTYYINVSLTSITVPLTVTLSDSSLVLSGHNSNSYVLKIDESSIIITITSIVDSLVTFTKNGDFPKNFTLNANGTINLSPPSSAALSEGLVLRKVNSKYIDSSKKWILMPPQSLSPYTIPSGKNRWCNYCTDFSLDGGKTFNGKTEVQVPMSSQTIQIGTEIIDAAYSDIAKQPDNTLFAAIGDTLEVAASLRNPVRLGYTIYELATHSQFHWQNTDPSFYKCANLCSDVISNIPEIKAVAISSGELGNVPPGHSRGITQAFSQGDVLFGHSVGGVTCENYYLYETNINNNPTISSRKPGEVYEDGGVTFVVQSTFNDTFLFDTSYFNSSSEMIIDKINGLGSGYGKTVIPTNVINSLEVKSQQFIVNTSTSSWIPTTPKCTSASNPAPCFLLPTISSSDLCNDSSTGIVQTIVNNLNKKTKWNLDVTSTEDDSGPPVKIPLSINFSQNYCNNPTTGSVPFYTVSSLKIDTDIQIPTNSSQNIITIPNTTDIAKFFPTIIDTKITTYDIIDTTTPSPNYLFDVTGSKLSADVDYGNFERQYKIYDLLLPQASTPSNPTTTTTKLTSGLAKLTQGSNSNIDVTIKISTTGTTEIQYTTTTTTKLTSGLATFTQGSNSNINVIVTIKTGTTGTISLMEATFIAYAELTLDENGAVSSDNENNITIISDFENIPIAGTTYDIQEWWTLDFTYAGYELQYQYHNSTASGCSIIFKQSPKLWSVTERAPTTLVKNDGSLLFSPDKNNPISLLNNSLMRHGDSPQQIIYTGSFEDDNIFCYTSYGNDSYTCKNNPKCSFNDTLGYCTGKDLIQHVSELSGDVFGKTDSFDPNFFNNKDLNSHFTNITFLKSLQIQDLNYQAYIPLSSQKSVGPDNVKFYAPPQFLNYVNQDIENLSGSATTVILGKFIPYQYFYPTSSYIPNTLYAESSSLQTASPVVNNFYINVNYTQFIPYGKKSLYENGFEKQPDVPTF